MRKWQSRYETLDGPALLGKLPPLPDKIQKLADKNYQLLKADPTHPSLHFKKVGKNKQLWSVRVGINYRALAVERPEGIVWFWIGNHADYDELVSR